MLRAYGISIFHSVLFWNVHVINDAQKVFPQVKKAYYGWTTRSVEPESRWN